MERETEISSAAEEVVEDIKDLVEAVVEVHFEVSEAQGITH